MEKRENRYTSSGNLLAKSLCQFTNMSIGNAQCSPETQLDNQGVSTYHLPKKGKSKHISATEKNQLIL